jgi:hypothetical protein
MTSEGKSLLWKRIRRNLTWLALLAFVWLMCSAAASAETLTARQQAFPHWQKPALQPSEGDLFYPDWLAGSWRMSSTLIDMVAPLAPDIVTPGFEGNRQFLDKPVQAVIRFVPQKSSKGVFKGRFLDRSLPVFTNTNNQRATDQSTSNQDAPNQSKAKIVSDRAFNGLSLARAYLGKDWVKSVKTDPNNPNRQITFLKDNRQLISTVTGRRVETPNVATFATTEIFQQFFRSAERTTDSLSNKDALYLNEVENTTIYRKQSDPNFPIGADQITAIYLSPQDPDYFKARNKPVALYRYQLSFSPL